ncbi:MAG: hypothetical protein SH856_06710 [Flavobacteriales bacterium]|nr:hypothetical protein [Flavobacteriales bacterium]
MKTTHSSYSNPHVRPIPNSDEDHNPGQPNPLVPIVPQRNPNPEVPYIGDWKIQTHN